MRTLILTLVTLAACTKDTPAAVEKPAPVAVKPAALEAKPAVDVKPGAAPRVVSMTVTEDGFQPSSIPVKQGEDLLLKITRTTDATCATEILIDGTDIKAALPLNKEVEVAWRATTAGKIKYGCAMNKMVSGVLLVE